MCVSNDKIAQVGINIQKSAIVIWNIANALFGHFKPFRDRYTLRIISVL